VTQAETFAVALLMALGASVIVPYVCDSAGYGIAPAVTSACAAFAFVGVLLWARRRWVLRDADTALLSAIVVVTTLWLASYSRGSLLPPGSGPDLTHHLLLTDRLQEQRALVHDPHAAAAIGEMAHYTPGFHVLVALTAIVGRVDDFFVVYPMLIALVALKFGVVALVVIRLAEHRARVLAIGAVATLMLLAPYTVGSFTRDSFFAQAAAELFAIGMWWALTLWWRQPAAWPVVVFSACGAAAFLTWPVWVGPPVIAFTGLVLSRRGVPAVHRLRTWAAGCVPIAAVAAMHVTGRVTALGLAGVSGALSLPAPPLLAWGMLPLATVGLFRALGPTQRSLAFFIIAIALQAAALWFVAARQGASTPYMALKMVYLAVYPITAAAFIGLAGFLRARTALLLTSVLLVAAAGTQWWTHENAPAIVSRDLWAAGTWARQHVPRSCVDYLVANEYTAYWLHLSVLGNPRSAARSADDDLYRTESSFARWIRGEGPPYAIARVSVLPREIRERVDIIFRDGDAAVLRRPGVCLE
jgi:hypothetical protein